AYSVHDVEDGVHSGMIKLGVIDDAVREQLCGIAAAQYSGRTAAALAPVLDALLDLPTLRDLADYDGTSAAQAAAKRATSELVGRLSGAAIAATRAEYGDGPLGRYAASLVVAAEVAAECALLKAIAAHYVMARPGSAERQAWQRSVLADLVSAVHEGAPATLDRSLAAAWHAAASDADRLRVVIDQVAQLTDTSALAWHARLVRPRQ
ncbi:MAG: deoxyguanosinetriphosphate triphosphohydrolase, partial [Jatrophihabitantaceae bacterium]